MEKYTLYIASTSLPKSKLQKEVYDLLEGNFHLKIHIDLFQLMNVIEKKIENINSIHTRCKPIKLTFYDFRKRFGSIYIKGIPNVTPYILTLKEVENEQ